MTTAQLAFMWGLVVGLWIAWACYLAASRWLRRTAARTGKPTARQAAAIDALTEELGP